MHSVPVSAVVVNCNGKHFLKGCLDSLKHQTYSLAEVMLVDNGSKDGSVELVERKFPWVKIQKNKTNLGLTAACNIGIEKSKGDLIALISNDTVLEKNCIERLVEAIMSSKTVGIAGGNIVLYANPKIIQSFPSRFLPSCKLPWTAVPVKVRYKSGDRLETDVVGLCVLLIKREVIKATGLIRKDYFMHFNEDDFSLRVKRAGYYLILVPTAVVKHFGSATIGKIGTRKASSFLKGEIAFRRINLRAWEILPSVCFAILIQTLQHLFMALGVTSFFPES